MELSTLTKNFLQQVNKGCFLSSFFVDVLKMYGRISYINAIMRYILGDIKHE